MIHTICAYCGSSDRADLGYLDAARQMGRAIACRGLALVYGAGSTGVMGALAEGALEGGGAVTGIIPKFFATPQLMHTRLTHLEVVPDMHTRKARLAGLADAFIALPGGYGTFEELFEMITWAQIGLHRKPIGLLNTRGYFNPLMALIEHARAEGFLYDEHLQLFILAEQPEQLLDALEDHRYPPGLERWVERKSS